MGETHVKEPMEEQGFGGAVGGHLHCEAEDVFRQEELSVRGGAITASVSVSIGMGRAGIRQGQTYLTCLLHTRIGVDGDDWGVYDICGGDARSLCLVALQRRSASSSV